jgi:hypothetical protein
MSATFLALSANGYSVNNVSMQTENLTIPSPAFFGVSHGFVVSWNKPFGNSTWGTVSPRAVNTTYTGNMRAAKWEIMDLCLFCEIVQGKAEATMVHEDEVYFAETGIWPVNPVMY